MDPRADRTRQRLRAAVLDLAGRRPLGDVTVAEICRAAEVTRDTFYRYAPGPAELLADALDVELSALAAEAESAPRIGDAERMLLQHVQDRVTVYAGTMDPLIAAPVRARLQERLAEGLEEWARRHPEVLPARFADDPDARAMIVAYAAGGTVGAIERWIAAGATDVDRAVDVILAASAQTWLR